MSGKLALDAAGKLWKIEKTCEPCELLPAAEKLKYFYGAMSRAALVNEGGRAWIVDFSRAEEGPLTDLEEVVWPSCRLDAIKK